MIHIDYSVRKIINKLFNVEICFVQDVSYGFDWITVSPTDKTRFSGIAANKNYTTFPDPANYETVGTFLKPGKFLAAIFPDVDQNEISRMAAKLQKHMSGDSDDFKRLKISATPSEIYKMQHKYSGDLGSSCMRHLDSDYFEIYDDSPTTKILYLEKGGELLARALLHEEVSTEEHGTIKFMDRIYTSNENQQTIFFKWAKENGYYRKYRQSYDYKKDVINPEGDRADVSMSIKVHSESYNRVPFMDTFTYYFRDSSELKNTSRNCDDELACTGGNSENEVLSRGNYYEYECEHCGIGVDESYTRYIDDVGYVCDACVDENYFWCEHCDQLQHTDERNLVMVDGSRDYTCTNCLEDHFTRCEECGDYTSYTTYTFRNSRHTHSYEVCERCLTDKDGIECEKCGEFYPETLDKCPRCDKLEREKIYQDRLPNAVQGFIDRAGFGVKNDRLTWIQGEYLFKIQDGWVYQYELRKSWYGIEEERISCHMNISSPSNGKSLFRWLRRIREESRPKVPVSPVECTRVRGMGVTTEFVMGDRLPVTNFTIQGGGPINYSQVSILGPINVATA